MKNFRLDLGNKTCIGIDIGSTTAKIAVIRNNEIIYDSYERHFSQVRPKTLEIIRRVKEMVGDDEIRVAISGSAGLGMARAAEIPFVQEVYATGETVKRFEPDTSVVIELGGEDAKVIFFEGGMDERMNGSCAGGTGAFIDQMASLLGVTANELDELSLASERIYPIASRCGVFAKTDIQPLINQGAAKSDIAASIYQAVVNQTIAGLAQGRRIRGKVMFLGGPLSFCQGLRERFVKTLKLSPENAAFPEFGRVSVALGAAIYATTLEQSFTYGELVSRIRDAETAVSNTAALPPLFSTEEEYAAFTARHARAGVPRIDPSSYEGDAYLGIDCGSTTTKLVLMSRNRELLYTYYDSNRGTPVEIVRRQLEEIYRICGDRIRIRSSAVTGYGEDLIRHAFRVDFGLVETLAHYHAARHFSPDVDFILDIGGQDIKCFKIKNRSIDSIMLNEACSSGCGSFIETFARALGYEIAEFSRLGLFAPVPVNLGSRCTVFMNSSVKQAQKDGATVADISAGLSMSVVKNAIYKVIRASSADELGRHVVVQGGTFYNDAVLRSFELELGREVIRPEIAGLMGAYGAAIYAEESAGDSSTLITPDELPSFTHESKATVCAGCGNRCHLTVNIFAGGERFISGNRCERGAGKESGASTDAITNLHEWKRSRIEAMIKTPVEKPSVRGRIGLPLALGMYELLPLWKKIFEELGFEVILSGFSTRRLYQKGQYSIPSDTACYPAKLMHGHIEELIEKQVDYIFYPGLSYNVNEHSSDNYYNCPVVAYYSELLHSNMDSLEGVRFLYPYLNVNDPLELSRGLMRALSPSFPELSIGELRRAVKAGIRAYKDWMAETRRAGEAALRYAKENGKRALILAGRPYHIDPEIGHGIDRLAASLGFVILSEDAIGPENEVPRVAVLNQWTYHSRLYRAAEYVGTHEGVELVQLVSFGCGIDAITTDEVSSILERHGKLYTQIKIDEITNLGAVKIRLRSLIGALLERENPKTPD